MTNFKFPIIELVDRYTIARVKYEKTNGANSAELEFYYKQMSHLDMQLIQADLFVLEDIHRRIWALEDDFKKCRLDGVDLAEIGRRALEIRDINNLRVQYKNSMAEKCNDAVREIKQDHTSEN
ncbi:hypothetical protein UFOVP112_220 [uncultured Caudovirales phage]|uniref:Uncharacterized protein n=1 Tax=uncultured Caudovirales phage TaxID=2100421 RepID=A0A6J5L6E2_9CAUD|nr:hypothetical protein UFOVP112_220 [uncultured Caudovirales phage]